MPFQGIVVIVLSVHRPPEAASNAEWKRWGDTDPFYAVAAWEGRQQGGPDAWTPEEFYDLGLKDWGDFRSHWDAYGRRSGSCIEIGCGAGRLTMHMTNDFDEVVGIDVSEGMLRVARTYISAQNAKFQLSNGIDLPVDTASADAVFSTHVFQHFDSHELALANFAEVARVLRSGASAMIHLPMYQWPNGLGVMERVLDARRLLGDMRAKSRRRQGRLLMRGLTYSWDWIFRELSVLGFSSVEICVFQTSSNLDQHAYVLMRRS